MIRLLIISILFLSGCNVLFGPRLLSSTPNHILTYTHSSVTTADAMVRAGNACIERKRSKVVLEQTKCRSFSNLYPEDCISVFRCE